MDLNRSLVMSMTQGKLMTSFPKSFFKTKFCTAKDIVVNLSLTTSLKTYIEVLYFCSLTVSPQENGRNYCLPTIHGRFVGRNW